MKRTSSSKDLSARAFHSIDQSIASGGFGSFLAFDSESYDNGNFHDNVTNNGRLTIRETGKYLITLNVLWAISALGVRFIGIFQTGSRNGLVAEQGGSTITGFLNAMNCSQVIDAIKDDYFTAYVFQNSGSGLNVIRLVDTSAIFTIQKINKAG